MKIKILALLLLFSGQMRAQINILATDMAKVNDTMRYSTSTSVIDYKTTDSNFTWNFSSLKIDNQDIQKYFPATSTPYILQFFGASYGLPENNLALGALGGGLASNVYSFYKSTNQSLVVMGRGATVQSLPLGIVYSLKDTLLKFPMNFGKTFSGNYLGEASLPTLGALKQSGSRTTVVDGWGKITTPFGTFDCIRVKSTIVGTDSIVFGGFGIPIPAARTEYTWLAKNQGFPILEVVVNNTTNQVTSIKFKDRFRPEAYINNCDFNANRLTGKPGDTINFTNASFGSPKSFNWQITPNTFAYASGFSATSASPRVIFNAIGDYNVKLIAGYEGASDDTLKLNYIKIREGAVANFYALNTHPKLNESVVLRDTSIGGVISWQWTITPNTGVVYLNGTSNMSQHPQVQFNQVGNFSVQLRVTNAIGNNTLKKTDYMQVWHTALAKQVVTSGVNFFPNPGKDLISIESPDASAIGLNLYDLLGNTILSKTLNNQAERNFNVSELARGVYLLELVQDGKKTAKRLILE
ncbi:MAG: T9SS type A sorting domain-containing protein [bacterium]|nr:T9SS type A sorting domain-containing protein [bacterium]